MLQGAQKVLKVAAHSLAFSQKLGMSQAQADGNKFQTFNSWQRSLSIKYLGHAERNTNGATHQSGHLNFYEAAAVVYELKCISSTWNVLWTFSFGKHFQFGHIFFAEIWIENGMLKL